MVCASISADIVLWICNSTNEVLSCTSRRCTAEPGRPLPRHTPWRVWAPCNRLQAPCRMWGVFSWVRPHFLLVADVEANPHVFRLWFWRTIVLWAGFGFGSGERAATPGRHSFSIGPLDWAIPGQWLKFAVSNQTEFGALAHRLRSLLDNKRTQGGFWLTLM